MKFYIHRKTGTPLAELDGLMAYVDGENEDHKGCIRRVVIPSKVVGNGVSYHVMHCSDISTFYKRISREKFFNIVGDDFGQLRHFQDKTIEYNYLKDVVKRKEHFGV